MSSSPLRRALLAVPALALLALAPAAQAGDHGAERLVVRGDSTIVDGPCGPDGCPLRMSGGAFRGTLGTGAYGGDLTLAVADGFPNGEGGVCAPIRGRITLGTGAPTGWSSPSTATPARTAPGPSPPRRSPASRRFKVTHGTGRYAKAHGRGLATFSEDAADHDRMTLVGRIAR